MTTDTEQLVVQLEAKINDFEKNMARAAKTADSSFTSMENRAKQAANSMQANMEKAASGVAGVFKGFGSTILGAAGIGGLGLTALLATFAKINSELAKIPGLAREAALSTDRLQQIKFAANIKGLGDEEFIAGMRTSLGLLDEAQRQVNSLQRLFNANGISIRNSNGDLIKFDELLENAARLMAGTSSEQQKIKIAEMVGLSREWVAVLRDGPEAFKQMAASANDAGAVIDKEIVDKAKEFDKAWKEAIVRLKAGTVDAFVSIGRAITEWWSNLIQDLPLANWLSDKIDQWGGGLRGKTLPELEDFLKRSIEHGMSDQEIDRIRAEIDRRLGREPLRITIQPAEEIPNTVVPKDFERNPFDRAVFGANKRIAEIEAETAAIGENTEVRERAKLVAELEEAAKDANTRAGFQSLTVTDAQREKINALAASLENVTKRQRESHEALMKFAVDGQDFAKQFDQFAISGFGAFENAFANIVTGTKDAKAAFKDMANSILADLAKMIIRMQVTAPLARAIGGAFNTETSFLPSLSFLEHGFGFHSGGSGVGEASFVRQVPAAAFIGAPRFHTGIGPGELPAIIRKDEAVLTPGQMKALGRMTGGSNVNVTVNNSVSDDVRATPNTRQNPDGSVDIEVAIERVVNRTISSGRADKSLSRVGGRPLVMVDNQPNATI